MVSSNADEFFENIAGLIEQARKYVGRTADLTMCVTYYEIGRMIVEEEQGGKARAQYGRRLLHELAEYLKRRVGKGFSVTNLRNARQFYQIYTSSIHQLLTDELKKTTKYQMGYSTHPTCHSELAKNLFGCF